MSIVITGTSRSQVRQETLTFPPDTNLSDATAQAREHARVAMRLDFFRLAVR